MVLLMCGMQMMPAGMKAIGGVGNGIFECVHDVIRRCTGHGGFAFGTGNPIPDYVPEENYLNMIEIVREYRCE